MRETPADDSSSLSEQGRAYTVKVGCVSVGVEVPSLRIQNTTMSEAEAKTTEKKMSKDVQIVAYLKADSDMSEREVMQSLDADTDYKATEVSVSDYYRMVFAGGEKRVSKDEFEYLKARDPAGIRLIHYQSESESHKNGSYSFINSIRRDVLGDVTMAMPNSDMNTWLGKKVKLDNKSIFKVELSGPDKMRKLKHQSEVEDGEIFEDDGTEYWTVTFRCKVEGLKPSLYRWFDDSVIPSVMKEVAKHDWVRQTRVMDCEKEYSESGVCFNL